MNKIIAILAKLGFWPFVSIFTILAIIISEFLMIFQSYWLTGDFFDTNLLIVGFITPTIDAFIVFTIAAFSIAYLHRLQEEKDATIALKKKAEEAISLEKERAKQYLDITGMIIVALDRDGNIMLANNAAYRLLGYGSEEELIGKNWFEEYLPESVYKSVSKVFQNIINGNIEPYQNYKNDVCLKDGTARLIEWHNEYIRDNNGAIEGVLSSGRDVTESKKHEEKLKLLASVFTYAHEGIVISDSENRIIEVNNTFLDITGFSCAEVIGKNPNILQSGRNDPIIYREMWKHLNQDGFWRGEIWNRKKDGEEYLENLTISVVYDDNQAVKNYVAIFTDVTQQKLQQQQLLHIAHYDTLTNLPNRSLFSDRMHQAMAQSLRREELIAVTYIDLDGFKEVNDTYGHEFGDKLLVLLSERMNHLLREGDTLSRSGGDEFIALLVDLPNKTSITTFLTRLLKRVSEPVYIDNSIITISASIGVTFYPQKEELDADQLIRQADQAMYQSKESGKNRYFIFDTDKALLVRHQNKDVDRVRLALNNEEFVLYYQPKVNIRTGDVIGVEALIRWQHPEDGLLSPADFLPLIENHELSVLVDQWVLEQAFEQLSLWHTQNVDLSISVNIGAKSLQKNDFIERLSRLLKRHEEVNPDLLMLEILETSVLKDLQQVSTLITRCATLGVKFALDDFGTGYSSLTYLKHLPSEQLKIDQSFVRDMLIDSNDLAILDGVLGFANAFGREAIAEGVESIEHGIMLLQLGCDLAQGYAIAKPMPVEKMQEWADNWKLPTAWQDIKIINRSEMPLLFASVEHRGWIKSIALYIKGIQPIPKMLESDQCHFGEWLHERGEKMYGNMPEYQTLYSLHKKVHTEAIRLVNLKQNDGYEAAIKQLNSLEKLSQQLLKELNHLYSFSPDKSVNL